MLKKMKSLSWLIVVSSLLGMGQIAYADSEYAQSWGPSIGTTAPMLDALDHAGNKQTFETMKGANGLLFVFNRSVDW